MSIHKLPLDSYLLQVGVVHKFECYLLTVGVVSVEIFSGRRVLVPVSRGKLGRMRVVGIQRRERRWTTRSR